MVLQLTLTHMTWWRMAAQGWVVDEDCLACPGRRREAVFMGAFSLVASAGPPFCP